MSSRIRVHDNIAQWVTIPRDKDDEWSHDSTGQSHDIRGIELTNDKYYDLEVYLDVEEGEYYLLVSVVYTTGDSFGSYGGQIEHIDLFKSAHLAEQLSDKIYANAKDYGNKSGYDTKDIIYELDNGETRTLYPGTWLGYFEHIDDVKITLVKAVRDEAT